MKKFAALILGLTLIWTNNACSIDDKLDTQKENHRILVAQKLVDNQPFEEDVRDSKGVTSEQLYWERFDRNIKDVTLGFGIGALYSLLLVALLL